MDLAHITPTAHLDDLLIGSTYHLILTQQVIKDAKYREFYTRRSRDGDFIILDNDAHELKDEPQAIKLALLQQAIDLMVADSGPPTEVVLPDRIGADCEETIELAVEGLRELNWDGAYMAVPHGSTVSLYHSCARALWEFGGVTSLGVSYSLEKELGVKRGDVVKVLCDTIMCDIHLLGEGAALNSLLDKDLHNKVRGLDTAKLVNWGLQGTVVKSDASIPPHIGRQAGAYGYFDLQLGPDKLWVASQNIRHWDAYCS